MRTNSLQKWSQDAARIGSLIKDCPEKEVELKKVLFNNLAHLHLENARVVDPAITFDKLHKEIEDSYITHHVCGVCACCLKVINE